MFHKLFLKLIFVLGLSATVFAGACKQKGAAGTHSSTASNYFSSNAKIDRNNIEIDTLNTEGQQNTFYKPLVEHIYTADPSAHVFNGRIYVYPSHDIEAKIKGNDDGASFAMRDYHVLSMDSPGSKVIDHGVALDIKDVSWASKQMWAPDAAYKDGIYYLYFPVKDKKGLFRVGVATSKTPEGPFVSEPEPVKGSYSMDPAVFEDKGMHYMYLGGLWGGQLQNWVKGKYKKNATIPKDNRPAINPVVARLSPDMKSLAEKPKEVLLLDTDGSKLLAGDRRKRFFEAAWVHKYKSKYYFSYSTGDTHLIAYAIGDNPYGPFRYQGTILHPVKGWTNHHSIMEFEGKWYLFYHDSKKSGKTHLRNVKMTELFHNEDGTIKSIDAYRL